jgi:hypothetical protein
MPQPHYMRVYVFADNYTEYLHLSKTLDESLYKIFICKNYKQEAILEVDDSIDNSTNTDD